MILLATMLARRRMLDASASRRRPRAVPKARHPAGVILEYTQVLGGVLRGLDDAVRAGLASVRAIRADSPEHPLMGSQKARVLDALAAELERIPHDRRIPSALDQIAARANAWSAQEFQRQIQSALGMDLLGDPHVGTILRRFRVWNVDLIRSLAGEKLDRVRETLTSAPLGMLAGDLAERIQRDADTTTARAALIARDQILKLNGQVTQARHQAVGITRYTWSTSRDARVRSSHRELDGKVFEYGKPPSPDGEPLEPGQAVNCRCVALPYLDEL